MLGLDTVEESCPQNPGGIQKKWNKEMLLTKAGTACPLCRINIFRKGKKRKLNTVRGQRMGEWLRLEERPAQAGSPAAGFM